MSRSLRVWPMNNLLPVLDSAQVRLEMGAGLPIMHIKVDDSVDSARIIALNKDSFPHNGISFSFKYSYFSNQATTTFNNDVFPSNVTNYALIARVFGCHLMSNKIDADLVLNWFNNISM